MKILAFTSIRSEYDLLSPLLKKIKADENIDLQILIGGAHNSSSFGETKKHIYKDDFNVLLEVESLIDANSLSSRLKGLSVLAQSSIDAIKKFSPDLIIYAGDREDVMVAALTGVYLEIPTIHFYGGDHASDGYVDNAIRHAVSKLSSFHFVSCDTHLQRLKSIGEKESRIFNIGSIALDSFSNHKLENNIIEKISGKKTIKKTALVIYHPFSSESICCNLVLKNIINSLLDFGYHCLCGIPNSDPGNFSIRELLNKYSNESKDVTFYSNLERDDFISLFKACDLMIGNSSAGILESASVPIPCINVGNRQVGRSAPENVLFVGTSNDEITEGLNYVESEEFIEKIKRVVNPYGDGKSSERALKLIKSIDFKSMLHKHEDPLHARD